MIKKPRIGNTWPWTKIRKNPGNSLWERRERELVTQRTIRWINVNPETSVSTLPTSNLPSTAAVNCNLEATTCSAISPRYTALRFLGRKFSDTVKISQKRVSSSSSSSSFGHLRILAPSVPSKWKFRLIISRLLSFPSTDPEKQFFIREIRLQLASVSL